MTTSVEGVEGPTASVVAPEKPDEILIAVMGITGSGKSTFISHCTEDEVPVGNHLQSHTQEVTSYRYKFAPEGNVHLIDTPGFDDTSRDDTDVLRGIADWLTSVYEKRIDLRGVIYLHRITDPRMQGSAMKNLFMFKKLCGPEGLKNVILATTMWENVAKEDGDRREAELRDTPDYWKTMIENHGSRMVRHQNGSDSARGIIDSLLESAEPITYAIQNEMVDQGKYLDQTGAGKELWSIQAEERDRFERQLLDLKRDMAEAKEVQDKESQEQIRKLQEEKNKEILKLQIQQEKMHISLAKLHKEEHEKLKKIIERLNSDAEKSKAELEKSKVEQEKHRQIIAQLTRKLDTYSLVRKESPDSHAKPDRATQDSPMPTSGRQLTLFKKSLGRNFSLSLCGQYYYFCGPVSNFYDVPPQRQTKYSQKHGTSWMVCMGPSGSWTQKYEDDKGNWRIHVESLKDTHRTLHDHIIEKQERLISFVSLGCHGWYCIRSTDGRKRFKGPPDIMQLEHCQKVWFGYDDSWVAETRDHFQWDLKGHYGKLAETLDGGYRQSIDDIAELALNIENGADWIILFKNGGYQYEITDKNTRKAFKAWREENKR